MLGDDVPPSVAATPAASRVSEDGFATATSGTVSADPSATFPVWRTLRFIGGIALAFFALVIAGFLAIFLSSGGKADLDNIAGLALQIPLVVAYFGTIALTLLALRRLGFASLGAAGLRGLAGTDFAVIGIALALHYAVAFAVVQALHTMGVAHHTQAGFEHFAPHDWPDRVADVIGLALVAPFAEELFFRGLIFNALSRWIGLAGGALVSSALFGAAHGDPVAFTQLFLDGIILCAVYRRTGNLYACTIVHGAGNLVATLALAAQH